MPKRSLGVKSLRFRQKGIKPEDAESYAPSDLDGANLLDLFLDWASNEENIPLMNKSSIDCLKICSVKKLDSESLLIDALTGKRGEEGELFDLAKSDPVFHITEEQAPTAHTRTLLYVPRRGEIALLFSEYCLRGASGARMHKLFSSYFSKENKHIKMDSESVLEGSEWLNHVSAVKNLEIKIHGVPPSAAASIRAVDSTISLICQPKKGQNIALNVLNDLRKRSVKPGDVLGFPDFNSEDADVLATVQGEDKRTKKINVFQEDSAPKFYRTLSENNEPELSDDEFVSECRKYAQELLAGLGQDGS